MNENVKIIDPSGGAETFVYKFTRGDTLASVGEKFHTTPVALIAINGFVECPRVGQYAVITRLKGNKYVVKPTDTLELICNYDTDKIAELKRNNRIDYIFAGQVIFI